MGKEGKRLDCREAQSLIVPFIKSELTMEQAKKFFEHISNEAIKEKRRREEIFITDQFKREDKIYEET